MTIQAEFPICDIDIFSEACVLNPHPRYKTIRDLGPVVKFSHAKSLCVARYAETREMLLNKDVFVSSRGVSLNDFINENLVGTVLNSDPPRHSRIRKSLIRPLQPGELAKIKDRIQRGANDLIDRLFEMDSFDGVADLAAHLPVSIVSTLVGLPEEGRENMLNWAAAAFDAAAPMDNARVQAAMPIAAGAFEYMSAVKRADLIPGSWADQLFDALDRGDIDEDMLVPMMIDYMTPSLDTTIAGIAQMLKLFGENPEQWDLLRNEPSLIPNAIEETLRMEAPIRGFARVADRDTELGGEKIAEGTRIYAIYGSANRDERQWEKADKFDIRRLDAKRHVAFGYGIHQCAGQHLARLEMQCILKAMLHKVQRIEVSNAHYVTNSALRVLSRMDTKLH